MKIGMTSDTRSLIEMSMISYWNIRARLLRVPGVANVAIWGERLQMLQVQVHPDKLEGRKRHPEPGHGSHRRCPGCGSAEVLARAFIGTGGFIGTPNQRMSVRHVLPHHQPRRTSPR